MLAGLLVSGYAAKPFDNPGSSTMTVKLFLGNMSKRPYVFWLVYVGTHAVRQCINNFQVCSSLTRGSTSLTFSTS